MKYLRSKRQTRNENKIQSADSKRLKWSAQIYCKVLWFEYIGSSNSLPVEPSSNEFASLLNILVASPSLLETSILVPTSSEVNLSFIPSIQYSTAKMKKEV